MPENSAAGVGTPSRNIGVGVALVIGSCLSLPFGAAVATTLFPALGTWGVTSLRVLIAAVVVTLIARPRLRHWNRAQWTAAILFGVSVAAMNGTYYAAIERIPLGPAVAIEFLGPLVLAAALTRRVVDFLWVGLALGGMALLAVDGLTGSDPLDPIGVLFALVAAGFWVMYIRTSTRVGALIPGTGGLAVALGVAAVLLLPFGIPAMGTAVGEPSLLLMAGLTALLASVIPYTLELAALRRLPQRVFGILLSLEPVFATLAGWIVLGQQATPLRMAAIALVVAASIGVTAGARRRRGAGPDEEPPSLMTGSIPVVPD
ncbi:EamA family transporter [Microbacterium resistens]|uniref:EamA family transporter n=1 Tax=Microbacterium resistens TaxID=156977 RepID=A0ABY3RQ99_9MICO|nr:EamA family transporter [Microbacterium resistens]MBW1639095.1 EamA family transporter [Microbacterium resistens]UGS26253.1 EamA family transporter [Microbacterium resistens]